LDSRGHRGAGNSGKGEAQVTNAVAVGFHDIDIHQDLGLGSVEFVNKLFGGSDLRCATLQDNRIRVGIVHNVL
jgi:hypothetical protein